jgi:hypothetical protein
LVDDWLPIDNGKAHKIFNQNEKDAVGNFMKLWDAVSDATNVDISCVAEFESSTEWGLLCQTAKQAVLIFSKRGRFSERLRIGQVELGEVIKGSKPTFHASARNI